MTATEERPVCILGVGRSGTSLVARVVNLLGIDLGPEETMVPSSGYGGINPSGFWEQEEIMKLNGEILNALGGSFLEPPQRTPGWERTPEMDSFRQRIEELIARNFGGRGRWGFKSPLTTATLPMWRSVAGEFDYVICVRNPIEVRRSARVWIPWAETGDAIGLWSHYTCEAVRLTAGRHRTFVFYEDWLADPMTVGRRLATFLYGSSDTVSPQTWDRISWFFDANLRRQRASELELARRDDIAPEARALHFLVRDLAAAEARGDEERARALQAVTLAMDRFDHESH
jgi:hypothetical protein